MPIIISAFLVGALFAVGLGISVMTHPEKVIGFLDFTGSWDASLMFVMGGAVIFYFLFFKVLRGERPAFGERFRIPTKRLIDRRLVVGAGLVGIGWALAGYCPGPAITSVGAGSGSALLFVGAMAGGMYLFKAFEALVLRPRAAKASTTGPKAKPVSMMLPTSQSPAQPSSNYRAGMADLEGRRRSATQA